MGTGLEQNANAVQINETRLSVSERLERFTFSILILSLGNATRGPGFPGPSSLDVCRVQNSTAGITLGIRNQEAIEA